MKPSETAKIKKLHAAILAALAELAVVAGIEVEEEEPEPEAEEEEETTVVKKTTKKTTAKKKPVAEEEEEAEEEEDEPAPKSAGKAKPAAKKAAKKKPVAEEEEETEEEAEPEAEEEEEEDTPVQKKLRLAIRKAIKPLEDNEEFIASCRKALKKHGADTLTEISGAKLPSLKKAIDKLVAEADAEE